MNTQWVAEQTGLMIHVHQAGSTFIATGSDGKVVVVDGEADTREAAIRALHEKWKATQ